MEARDRKIMMLYKEGLSHCAIGESIGISKSTVSVTIKKLYEQGKIKLRQPKTDLKKNTIQLNRARFDKQLIHNYDYPAPDDAVTIMELNNDSCRFPFNSCLFCGKISIQNSSYCKEHDKMCVTMRTKARC